MSEYEKQAEDFCKKFNVSFKVEYLTHGKYFEDDKETRDIYRITLSRNKKRFSFKFGQSINNSKEGISPTKYDVLSCLTKYDPEDFDFFCSNYGYNNDSRKAERTYKAVQKEYRKVIDLFSDCIEELREIN